MRLKKYINEITNPTVNKTIKIIESNLSELYRILSKKNWKVDSKMLVKILNGLFKRYKIGFHIEKESSSGAYRKYVAGARAYRNGTIEIGIYDNRKVSKFFLRFVQVSKFEIFNDVAKNAFLRELFDVISHELVHDEQLKKSDGKGWYPTDELGIKEYLSDPTEIEAYAQQVAMEIHRKGKSSIMQQYFDWFDLTDKPMKRFLKKLSFYMIKLK